MVSAQSIQHLLDTSDFPARWNCGRWTQLHGWVHVVSDLAIFGAYLAIPVVLVYFIRKRRDLPFSGVFLLFGAFILSCGTGHLVESLIFWWPVYRVSALLKVVTAVASWGTVLCLIRIVPRALTLPGLAAANERLTAEVKVRQQIEESLRRSEERYRSFLFASSAVVWATNTKGEFTEPQESWAAYTGQGFEQHRGFGWCDALHPQDRVETLARWSAACATGEPYESEGRVWSESSGEYRRFRCRAVPVRDHDGTIREWVGAIRDVEDQVQAEERFERVVEGAPIGMLMVARDGRITLTNELAERLFGYDRDELVGRSIETLVPERFRAAHPGYRESFFENADVRSMGHGRDLYGVRKDGSEIPVEIALNPIVVDGELYTLGSVTDITARKVAEEALRAHTDELETLNHQLEQATRALERNMGELERSNAELDEFAYVASHDLKEPLRGIHNYATFLSEDYGEVIDEEGQQKLSTVIQLSRRMDALIDSLLHFSRVGRSELARSETDLNQLVGGVLDMLAVMLRERSVDVRIVTPLPTLWCDSTRIGEIFQNLVTNAVKYNDKDTPHIEIGYEEDPGSHELVFYVRDNGIGIEEKHHDKVFRIFKRLHSREAFGGGSGAGLTIVQKIVERHGGRVWIESTLGVGSTFFFTLGSAAAPVEA